MIKFLIKNPKRIFRNFSIILIAYIIGAIVIAAALTFTDLVLPIWAVSLISTSGSIIVTFLVIAVWGKFANAKDAELRRRFKQEISSTSVNNLAAASGIQTVETTRSVKEIKTELKALTSELYNAQERDKNLKLAKKF